jgi:hypothetical protein
VSRGTLSLQGHRGLPGAQSFPGVRAPGELGLQRILQVLAVLRVFGRDGPHGFGGPYPLLRLGALAGRGHLASR